MVKPPQKKFSQHPQVQKKVKKIKAHSQKPEKKSKKLGSGGLAFEVGVEPIGFAALEQAEGGVIIEEEEKEESQLPAHPPKAHSTREILGYSLFSEPATQAASEPLIAGCLYKDKESGKKFFKVRKLAINPSFLAIFISMDQQTGHAMNTLSGEILEETKEPADFVKSLLKNREAFFDLYSLYVRTHVKKKEWPRYDRKFYLFSEVDEA